MTSSINTVTHFLESRPCGNVVSGYLSEVDCQGDLHTWSTNAVTTLNFGNLVAKFPIPSGLAIKFRKSIRSSGTPRALRTSTAMMAEPPIYTIYVTLILHKRYDWDSNLWRTWGQAGVPIGQRCPREACHRRAWAEKSPHHAELGSSQSSRTDNSLAAPAPWLRPPSLWKRHKSFLET